MASIWAILSAFVFLYLLRKLFTKKKNMPPGPRALPIIGHLHLFGKNPHHALQDLAKKHGPILGLRLGLKPAVVVSSPAAAELVLKTYDHVFSGRPSQESSVYISYGQRNIAYSTYGPYWRDMRKLCTLELLSSLRINQFRSLRKGELGLMIESLKRAGERRETVNLSKSIASVIGDINCLMVFGTKFADGDLDESGFKAVIAETLELSAQFNLADYYPFIGWLDLQGMNTRLRRLSKIFDGFLEKIIEDHIQNKEEKKSKDFVDIMMGILNSGEAAFEFDRRHVKAVLLDMLVAGIDTAATVLEWAMSELIRHPKVAQKLQKELESVAELGHMVDEAHLNKLEYLDCVVKETLRIHPAAPLLVPHASMEDLEVDGYLIPKKTRVMVNAYAIGRDPNVWSNPEAFIPERFSESNIDLRGRDFQLIPFGSGRRSCPGMQLGLTMVKTVLVQLVHCFDWELPNGMNPDDLDMTEHFSIVTGRANHLMAVPTYRMSK